MADVQEREHPGETVADIQERKHPGETVADVQEREHPGDPGEAMVDVQEREHPGETMADVQEREHPGETMAFVKERVPPYLPGYPYHPPRQYPSSAAPHPYVRSGVVAGLWKMAFLAGVLSALGVAAICYSKWRHAKSPYLNLRAFAVSEIFRNDLNDEGDLKCDKIHIYAQAACVEGPSANAVREALHIQLGRLPKEMREDVVKSAVIKGVSSTNSHQDTTVGMVGDGTAYSYIAFWSTAYNRQDAYLLPKYSSCVMVAGIKLNIVADVVGFEESSYSRQIGSRPCECNMLFCKGQCPVFEMATKRTPIFERYRMTIKEQIDLHRWMVKQAVGRASSLVDTSADLKKLWKDSPESAKMMSIGWTPPDENVFLGREDMGKHKGTGCSIRDDMHEEL